MPWGYGTLPLLPMGYNEAGSIEFRAMRFGNSVAEHILANRPELVEQITVLFRQGLKSHEIGIRLNGSMELPDDITDATRGAIVRRVLRVMVPDEDRRAAAKRHYRENLLANRDVTAQGRDEWMQRNGMVVWSDDEDAFFWELTRDPAMLRPARPGKAQRMNHEAIAAAMNRQFNTTVFIAKVCRDRYAVHRYNARQKEKAALAENAPPHEDALPET